MGGKGEILEGFMDFLLVIINFRVAGSEVQVAVLEIHRLVQRNTLELTQVPLNQWVELRHLATVVEYTDRPDKS